MKKRQKMTELKTKKKNKFQLNSTYRLFKVIDKNTEATPKGSIWHDYCVCFL